MGSEVMKDFVHEALQYVEFNDNLDIVDFANESTDRMISYSGDIISTRYDDQDFYLILIRIIYSINLRKVTVIFSKFNRNLIRL